jgi:hypothetical protein
MGKLQDGLLGGVDARAQEREQARFAEQVRVRIVVDLAGILLQVAEPDPIPNDDCEIS